MKSWTAGQKKNAMDMAGSGRSPGNNPIITTGICLFLIISCILVFGQVRSHDFILYDDQDYLVKNQYVLSGLTLKSLKYAFTSTFHGHWHPLTWLSHCLDIEIFGPVAVWHHLVNLALHIVVALVLFFAFRRMTGAVWRCAFVAALFALHPLHVETVAWIADRKDLLCGLFWFLTIWAYARYTEQPGVWRYSAVLAGFVFGMMSKSIMIMLPFVLLCLDYWPLNRFPAGVKGNLPEADKIRFSWPGVLRSPVFHLIREKIPFFLLLTAPAVFALLTVQVTEKLTLNPLKFIPGLGHMFKAGLFFTNYIHKLIIPLNLTLPTPQVHFYEISKWKTTGCLVLILAVSALVIKGRRRYPFLVTGWLWYLIILFPISGMIRILVDKIADRYSYISLTGLFIMIAWGAPELLKRWRHQRAALAISAIVVTACLMSLSWNQTRYWKNSITLFQHTIDVYPDDYKSRIRLAAAFMNEKKFDEAIVELNYNIQNHPHEIKTYHNLGVAYKEQKKFADAEQAFRKALAINPNYWQAYSALGLLSMDQGKDDDALYHFQKTIQFRPNLLSAHRRVLKLLINNERIEEAVSHFEQFVTKSPKKADARAGFAKALEAAGQLDEAIIQYGKALKLKPENAENQNSLGIILAKKGNLDEAVLHYRAAIKVSPKYADAHYNLAVAFFRQGYEQKAQEHLSETIRLSPDFAQAHNNLGIIRAEQGNLEDAVMHFSRAIEINPKYADAEKNLNKAMGLIEKRSVNP
jgi:protein O-mannosyl-transferase